MRLSPRSVGHGRLLRRNYDAFVFGGGPAGAAAALALARKGLAVVVFAKAGGKKLRIGETVPPAIVQPLARLDLWLTFLADAHAETPGSVAIWGNDQPYENDFLFNPYGRGWHLDRGRFDAMLVAAAEAAGAVLCAAPVEDCAYQRGVGWMVCLADCSLTAPWVIDATGRAAWFARRLGAKRHRLDRLVAVFKFAAPALTDETRTLIESCEHGWWYAAPLPDRRVIAAYFTDLDLLPRNGQERSQAWHRMLAATRLISTIVPASMARAALNTIDASSGRVLPYIGERWLAIGDANQFYDPLSGQGIFRAITTALRAADIIVADQGNQGEIIGRFVDVMDREYETYVATRLAYYRREQRWSRSVFWKRRSSGGAAG